MRWINALIATVAVVVPACKMDNPGFGLETDATTDASGPNTATDSRGSTTDSASGTTDATSGGSTDGSATTGVATTTASTGTTGGEACVVEEGKELFFKLLQGGNVLSPCGSDVFQIAGPVTEVSGGWVIRNCVDACFTDCQGEEFLLEVLGPSASLPLMDDCVVVRMDQNISVGQDVCEASAISIHSMGDPYSPIYAAAREGAPPPTGLTLGIEKEVIENTGCTCQQDGCCGEQGPGMYGLWFYEADIQPTLTQGQNKTGVLFPNYGTMHYEISVPRAHRHEECTGDQGHFDWSIRRPPGG